MSGKERDLSTPWSDWIWSQEHGCKYATRHGPTGEVEYDWLEPEEVQETPRYTGEWPSDDVRAHGGTSPVIPPVYTTSTPTSSSNVKTTTYNIPSQYGQRSSAGPSTSRAMNDITQGVRGLALQGNC